MRAAHGGVFVIFVVACVLTNLYDHERVMSMQNLKHFTAIIEREDDSYVALCPELDIASQGVTVEEARQNLKEALELFFDTASEQEIRERLHEEDSQL